MHVRGDCQKPSPGASMKFRAFCFFILFISISAKAASVDDAIEELFRITELKVRIAEMTQKTTDAVLQQNPQLVPHKEKIQAFYARVLDWNAIKPDFVKLYKKYFSEKEINDITGFYKTPTGKKSMQVMPTVMMESMQIGMKRVQDKMPELKKMLDDIDGKKTKK